jgi:hypothetical protein
MHEEGCGKSTNTKEKQIIRLLTLQPGGKVRSDKLSGLDKISILCSGRKAITYVYSCGHCDHGTSIKYLGGEIYPVGCSTGDVTLYEVCCVKPSVELLYNPTKSVIKFWWLFN